MGHHLMDGKTVFMTGAAGGIGFATARKMLDEGALALMFTDIDEEVTTRAAQKLREEFPDRNIEVAWPNLCVESEVCECMRAFTEKYGKLDAVCSIAGITHNTTIKRIADGEFQHQVDVNLIGTYNVDRQAGLIMRNQKFGSIINTSSICGIYGNPMGCGYGASKAGVIGLTKSLGRELGYFNIRVNCIAPGAIRTPMSANLSKEAKEAAVANIALRRMGEPEEVADMYVFLASDMSTYCTAGVFNVDGFSI